jgi:hypothetical protein
MNIDNCEEGRLSYIQINIVMYVITLVISQGGRTDGRMHAHKTNGLKELNDSGHCTVRHLANTH